MRKLEKMSNLSQRQVHTLDPVFNSDCKVLVLGSFPSPKSREIGFYYGNPQNRFWSVLSRLYNTSIASDNQSRAEFCLDRHIGLWDVLHSCEIVGASDASIENVEVNDIASLIKGSSVDTIFTTGNTSYKLYCKYLQDTVGIKAIKLPSTSPANARWSLDKLVEAYQVVIEAIEK